MTGVGEVGRAVIAGAGARSPICGQCGIYRGAGGDDQHIRPIAKVSDTVSAGNNGETVLPRAAGQRVIAHPAIQAIIARAAAEVIVARAAAQADGVAGARIYDRPALGAGCRSDVHMVTRSIDNGRAVIPAAGGGGPIRRQSDVHRGAGRDDQHIRPNAEIGDAVSARADDETVGPHAASQRITPGAAIQVVIAIAATEAIVARASTEAIGASAADQRIGIGRAGQADGRAIARLADLPTMGAGCCGEVHRVTCGSEAGRAGIAAAGGRRPVRSQGGIDRGAGRDDQHIRPSAEIGDAVSARADDEAVAPHAAGQRIIA